MPPPEASDVYHIIPNPFPLYLYQLAANTPLPASLLAPLNESNKSLSFKSITWTSDEISIVTDIPSSSFPELNTGSSDSLVKQGEVGSEYIGLRIKGPMELCERNH
jgi:hypothetical protein